jgi:hypothetical protein
MDRPMSTRKKSETTSTTTRRLVKVGAKRNSNGTFAATSGGSLTAARPSAPIGAKAALLPPGRRTRETPKAQVSAAVVTEDLGQIAKRLWSRVPEEERRRIPKDGAAQHDHYLYGTPKRT